MIFFSVCETTFREVQVEEDEPVCETIEEQVCDEASGVCEMLPKQVCALGTRSRTKTHPDTKVSSSLSFIGPYVTFQSLRFSVEGFPSTFADLRTAP